MPNSSDGEALTQLMELMLQLVRERDEAKRIVSAFGRKELAAEEVVKALSSLNEFGFGATVRALAEFDKDVAQRLAERARGGINAFLAELDSGRHTPEQSAGAPFEQKRQAATRIEQAGAMSHAFKDRDDGVLVREYVIFRMIATSNAEVRSPEIFNEIKKLNAETTEEAITAHLVRLQKSGLIGRARKGRYHAVPASRRHLAALSSEIEARRLETPII